jgi:hypothetical protein
VKVVHTGQQHRQPGVRWVPGVTNARRRRATALPGKVQPRQTKRHNRTKRSAGGELCYRRGNNHCSTVYLTIPL